MAISIIHYNKEIKSVTKSITTGDFGIFSLPSEISSKYSSIICAKVNSDSYYAILNGNGSYGNRLYNLTVTPPAYASKNVTVNITFFYYE